MGKLNKKGTMESGEVPETVKKNGLVRKSNVKKSKIGLPHDRSKLQQNIIKKKVVGRIIMSEYKFISNLFEILDMARLNQGRRNESDEDENSDSMHLSDIPDQKMFKKQTQKKGSSKVSLKNKSFPQTIEGLEKELAEIKGAPMSYQKKLRQKGLQSRLSKKKRKEQMKLLKASKTVNKHNSPVNGLSKTKPILNSDGNVVSNKFDFADTDIKKENKKKGAGNEMTNQDGKTPKGHFNKSENSFKNSLVKKETPESIKAEPSPDIKTASKTVFNKDNKMVFSKVYVPENSKKISKKDHKKKNTKKILEKLKEENKIISELEKEDKEKAVSLKEKQKWSAALKRASGEKVKDDPELLRKSIAREKNKKMRSQKKWKSRIDHVEKEREEKQKKRKENIQARKSEKKKKKMKKAIKKGSYVPL